MTSYINVCPKPVDGPWGKQNIPEIAVFGALGKYCCQVIGTILTNQAEKIALQYADMTVASGIKNIHLIYTVSVSTMMI